MNLTWVVFFVQLPEFASKQQTRKHTRYKIVLGRDQIFFSKFSQTVEFSEEGGESGDETEDKEPGRFQKKKNEKKIWDDIPISYR